MITISVLGIHTYTHTNVVNSRIGGVLKETTLHTLSRLGESLRRGRKENPSGTVASLDISEEDTALEPHLQ